MFGGFKNFTIRAIAGANVASIALMALVGFSDCVNPAHYPLLSIMGLFFPLFLVINFLFLFFWLLFKVRYALIPFAGFLLCYVPIRKYMPINPSEDIPKDAIKVLSYNTLSFAYGATEEGEVNPIVEYVKEQQADIVCLQEATPSLSTWQQIDSLLCPDYAYVDTITHPNGNNGMMVLSKYPILRKERIPYESNGNLSAAFFLRIQGKEVILINNHLETTGLSIEERQKFKSLVKGHLETDTAEQTSKLLLQKLAESTKKRAPQAEAVAKFIREHKGASILLCGDFNDGPISYAHRTVAKELTDCYVESGNGPGISYNRGGFYVRIDNIMCSDDWKPYGCHVDNKIAVSDHYPILCYLKKRSKR